MTDGFMFLYLEFGQECLEQLYTGFDAVLTVCLLNLGKISGTLEHLAAVIILGRHVPDIVDLFCSTLRKVLFNKLFHLLPCA